MPRSRVFLLLVLLYVSSLPLVYSQLPDRSVRAEAILDRYVQVTGGQAAYDRVRTQVVKVTYSIQGRVAAQSLSYRSVTGNYREIAMGGRGEAEQGVNQGVAWRRTADSAEILDQGEERASLLRSAVLLSDGHWREFYTRVEAQGTDTIDGRLCDRLIAVPFAGEPQTLFYDQQTGLLAKQVIPAPGSSQTEIIAEQYFEVQGVQMPRIFSVRAGTVTLRAEVNELKFNQPIPDSTFALPPEIEKLMKTRLAFVPTGNFYSVGGAR